MSKDKKTKKTKGKKSILKAIKGFLHTIRGEIRQFRTPAPKVLAKHTGFVFGISVACGCVYGGEAYLVSHLCSFIISHIA